MITACYTSSNLPLKTKISSEIVGGSAVSEEVAEQISLEERRALYLGKASALTLEQEALYQNTVLVLLQEKLWTERDMYDAGHYLMVLMYYAFWSGDVEKINAFGEFFTRFSDDIAGDGLEAFQNEGELNRLHFLYLYTQFANLCLANGYETMIVEKPLELAEQTAENYLLNNVGYGKTEETELERLKQILQGKSYSYKFYSSIHDFDKFSLAILCDLNWYHTMTGEAVSETMNLAKELSYELFHSPLLNTETELGGWLFQVGVTADSKDKIYAGHSTIKPSLEPLPREDIPSDSSHAHRLPLQLRSWQSAQTDRACWELFQLRREQLANQMVHYVLKNENGNWLTTTFMDGTNGIYRYSYHVDGVGLESYDLSGIFCLDGGLC